MGRCVVVDALLLLCMCLLRSGGVENLFAYMSVEAHDADCIGNEPIYTVGSTDVIGYTTSGGYGHATQQSLGTTLSLAMPPPVSHRGSCPSHHSLWVPEEGAGCGRDGAGGGHSGHPSTSASFGWPRR